VTHTPPPPSKARLRRLSDEEIELWLSVTKTVARRPGASVPRPVLQAQVAAPIATPGPATPRDVGRLSPGRRNATNDRGTPTSLAPLEPLERRLKQRLARGQTAPDAAIDLHGMCRQEAFSALRSFLTRAQLDGAKLVLVVTGKGGRDGDGTPGILRRTVPQWLYGSDYRSLVVGFEEAARSHGGTGALYVRIRRRDKANPL
jgi:DNA-nicking Smr family endonuclease